MYFEPTRKVDKADKHLAKQKIWLKLTCSASQELTEAWDPITIT